MFISFSLTSVHNAVSTETRSDDFIYPMFTLNLDIAH
jgi:hypothetical protein